MVNLMGNIRMVNSMDRINMVQFTVEMVATVVMFMEVNFKDMVEMVEMEDILATFNPIKFKTGH